MLYVKVVIVMSKITYKSDFSNLTDQEREDIFKLGDGFCDFHNNIEGPRVYADKHRGYIQDHLEGYKENSHLLVMYYGAVPISFCIYRNDKEQRKN